MKGLAQARLRLSLAATSLALAVLLGCATTPVTRAAGAESPPNAERHRSVAAAELPAALAVHRDDRGRLRGLGYAIAAFDPARHWPIVLVGFLGKVFGPLGMAQALWTDALPWGFAPNCVTNDLIWWAPFALILKYAWDQHRSDVTASDLPDEATLLAEARTRGEQPRGNVAPSAGARGLPAACRLHLLPRGAFRSRGPALRDREVRSDARARPHGNGRIICRLRGSLRSRRGTLAQLLGLSVWWRSAQVSGAP